MILKKLYKKFKFYLRECFITKKWREKINITDRITIFSSDCTGGMIYHDLKLEFASPTVNMYLSAEDYLKFIESPGKYLNTPMKDITSLDDQWPVALIKDITLNLVHYNSVQEAQKKWNERKRRINWDNVVYIFNDRNGCTYDLLKRYESFHARKKIVFTHKKYSELSSAYYVEGFENNECVGTMTAFRNALSISRRYDIFDWGLYLYQ